MFVYYFKKVKLQKVKTSNPKNCEEIFIKTTTNERPNSENH